MKTSLDKKPARTLTAADRCDRCSARALVEIALLQGGSLLWCGYHFGFFEDGPPAVAPTLVKEGRGKQPLPKKRRTPHRGIERMFVEADP